jgi:hypothetical protein
MIHPENPSDEFKPRPYYVKGILDADVLGVVYGDPGSGKTAILLDMLLHVAAGQDWFGHRVRRAGVLIVAMEGQTGLHDRILAARIAKPEIAEMGALFVWERDLRFTDDAVVDDFIARAREPFAMQNAPLGVVVIDTLFRARAGLDIIKPDVMGSAIMAAERIRDELGVTVLLVHHKPKGGASAYGSVVLNADIDLLIEVRASYDEKVSASRPINPRTLSLVKHRDGPSDIDHQFNLDPVDLGIDDDGDPRKSVIVEQIVDGMPGKRRRPKGQAGHALEILEKLYASGSTVPLPQDLKLPCSIKTAVKAEVWRDACEKGGLSEGGRPGAFRKAFSQSRGALRTARWIGLTDELVWLTKEDPA